MDRPERRTGHASYGRRRITGGLWMEVTIRSVELANSEAGPGVRIEGADIDTVIDELATAARQRDERGRRR